MSIEIRKLSETCYVEIEGKIYVGKIIGSKLYESEESELQIIVQNPSISSLEAHSEANDEKE